MMSLRLSILALALAACGGGSGKATDMSVVTDLSSATCSAAGGHCIAEGDGCQIGGAPGNAGPALGCASSCCVPLVQCNFPACDGGACECPMVGQACTLDADDICMCMKNALGALEWSCNDN
jgi:hypothetical protein